MQKDPIRLIVTLHKKSEGEFAGIFLHASEFRLALLQLLHPSIQLGAGTILGSSLFV